MIRDKRKKRVLGLIISAFVIVCITTVSYSFFKLVMDNTNPEKVALTTGTMELVFADNDNEVIGGSWGLGESITKKFTLTNTGTVAASASLDWKNLINTYQNRSLSYRLLVSTSEDGPTTEVVPETNMPVTSSPIRQTICSEISVPVGTTYYYQLIITYNNLEDLKQNVDIEAEFNTEFIVDQPKKYRYYRLTVNTNGGAFSDNTITKEHLLKHQNTVELEEPTKTGYNFAGWRIQGTDSTVEGTTFTMGISDTYLYAKWTPKEYILSINRNDGSSIENKTVKYNTPTVIENPTREGYTFTGWNVTGGTFNGNEFTLTTPGNTSIEATWEKLYKYIVYHNQQNVDGNGYTMVSADTDENYAKVDEVVTPETKTYTGFTSPEKKSLTIQAETTYPPLLNKIDYNYSRNKYTLTIDPNGGLYNGNTSPTTESIYYGASKELSTSTRAELTLAALGKTSKNCTHSYADIATTDETADGLCSLPDNYDISYYYRGAVTDNYVNFAGYYWRIIRVNGDGSLRMIYDGTVAHKNGNGAETFETTGVDGSTLSTDRFALTEVAWNTTNYNDAKYVGYMYGGANGIASTEKGPNYSDTTKVYAQNNETNTNIKAQIESWYSTNLSSYDEYIADSIYCADRSMGESDSTYTNLGYGNNPTNYAARTRFNSSAPGYIAATPTFICPQANDMFTKTVQTVNGKTTNGKLGQKVGLITADEIVAAGSGAINIINRNYYLYKSSNKWYWSLTPSYVYTGGYARVFAVSTNGYLDNGRYASTSGAVAPVISLKAEYATQLTGEGTTDSPFTLPESATSSEVSSAPEKTGYTFTGWTKTSGKGTLEGSTYTMGDGDATVTANYTPKSYSVTFNANGGTVTTESKIVTYDDYYGDLPEPTYEGYKFVGWYTAQTGGEQVTKNTKVTITSNQELFAHWKETNTLMAINSGYADKMWSQKANITEIVFENTITVPVTYAYSYDISSENDSSVMAYLVTDTTDSTKYVAHIQANGKIYANRISNYLFSGFNNLKNITGLENVITTRATDMSYMFYKCGKLTSLDLSNFDTSKVTDMSSMFYYCEALTTLDVSNFNTSNVSNMSNMFYICESLTSLDLSNFDTSNVTNMSNMFRLCNKLTTLNLSGFNTSKVTDMSSMFYYCEALTTLDVSNFNTSSVTNMSNMFYICKSLTSLDLSNFDTSNVTDMNNMFLKCKSLTSLDLSNFDTSNVTNMSWMFSECYDLTTLDVSNFVTSNVTDMERMFDNCKKLTTLDLSNFDTSNVTNMSSIFYECSSLTELNVSNFNTSNVTKMGSMFYKCSSLTELNVSNFNTSNVTSMGGMFGECSSLTELNVSNFNTSNVTSMWAMFDSCSRLTTLDVSNFDTSNVTSMELMFSNCSNITTLDVSNFDTSKVTDMNRMFRLCNKLTTLNLSGFNTSKVTDMSDMFDRCTSLTTLNISNFNISSVTNKSSMFSSVPSSIRITVKTTELRNWVIAISSYPKLTTSNFVIG